MSKTSKQTAKGNANVQAGRDVHIHLTLPVIQRDPYWCLLNLETALDCLANLCSPELTDADEQLNLLKRSELAGLFLLLRDREDDMKISIGEKLSLDGHNYSWVIRVAHREDDCVGHYRSFRGAFNGLATGRYGKVQEQDLGGARRIADLIESSNSAIEAAFRTSLRRENLVRMNLTVEVIGFRFVCPDPYSVSLQIPRKGAYPWKSIKYHPDLAEALLSGFNRRLQSDPALGTQAARVAVVTLRDEILAARERLPAEFTPGRSVEDTQTPVKT